jgi:DHA1 family bicyclomycin/chloramphenicol resistance-like MFS transporter
VVFIQYFHLTPSQFAGVFGVCAAWLIAASQVNPRILPHFGPSRVLSGAVHVSLLATAALMLVAFTGWGGIWGVLAPLFANMACFGFVMPNATVGALSRHAGHAGSASALIGTLQFLLGAASGLLVGVLSDGTARPMAILLLAGAIVANLADWRRPRA